MEVRPFWMNLIPNSQRIADQSTHFGCTAPGIAGGGSQLARELGVCRIPARPPCYLPKLKEVLSDTYHRKEINGLPAGCPTAHRLRRTYRRKTRRHGRQDSAHRRRRRGSRIPRSPTTQRSPHQGDIAYNQPRTRQARRRKHDSPFLYAAT